MRAGLRLGGLAFLAGVLLGPMRELLLAPRMGGLAAAWIEAAAMAVLVWLAARASVPRAQSVRDAGVTGLTALAFVLVAEAALGILFLATGLAGVRVPRSLAEQAPGFLLLGWVAALPLVIRARG
jgi:hypothetical protein